jgi:glutaredoxin
MKFLKKISIFILSLVIWASLSTPALAQDLHDLKTTESETQTSEKVVINFFFSRSCPHCAEEAKFLDAYIKENPQVEVRGFEVSSNPSNARLLQEVGNQLEIQVGGVPMTFIGNNHFIGYRDDATHGEQIKQWVEECQSEETTCPNIVEQIANQEYQAAKQNLLIKNLPMKNLLKKPVRLKVRLTT